MNDNKLTTYQLKVDKDIWKRFKGTSYILGFNSVNDCLNHLIDDCVSRADFAKVVLENENNAD